MLGTVRGVGAPWPRDSVFALGRHVPERFTASPPPPPPCNFKSHLHADDSHTGVSGPNLSPHLRGWQPSLIASQASRRQNQPLMAPIKPGETATRVSLSLCKPATSLLAEPGKGLPLLQESEVGSSQQPSPLLVGSVLSSHFTLLLLTLPLFLSPGRSLSLDQNPGPFATVSPVPRTGPVQHSQMFLNEWKQSPCPPRGHL